MKHISGKRIAKILKKNGWELKRTRGSHHYFSKEGKVVNVPIHRNQDLKTKTQIAIMNAAGIKETDL